MFEQTRTGVTLNLTKPFILWTAVFLIAAAGFHSVTLIWIALLPWLAMLAFSAGMMVLFGVIFVTWYVQGKPINYTNSKGEQRIIQRGR